MKIEMMESQLSACKELLGRTQLQGREVPAYLDVLKALVPVVEAPIKEEIKGE